MLENLDDIIIVNLGFFSINATLFFSWIVMAVLVIGSWLITRNLKASAQVSRFQTFLELIVTSMRDQIHEVSGDNPMKYLPMMGTFFLFIAVSNVLTIIPWFKAPTTSLSTTAAFASCVFCAIPYYGIKNAGILGYLKKFIDPTPFMLPLNILSDFSSIFSLALRLYGNMFAGAVLIAVLMMSVPFFIPLPLQILGLVTGTIQAYIFALLAIVYVSAVAPNEAYVQSDTKKGV